MKAVTANDKEALLKAAYSALSASTAASAETKNVGQKVYEHVLKSKTINEDISVWGLYTLLNLAGTSIIENNIPKQAVRFSHLFLGEKTQNLDLTTAKNAITETFKEENRFPWITKAGTRTTEDPRLKSISFDKTQFFALKNDGAYIPNYLGKEKKIAIDTVNANNHHAPIVCVIDHDANNDETLHIHAQISKMLDKNPFVILLRKQDNNQYVAQIFTNHEYMDGIPASYYLRNFLKYSGIEVSDLQDKQKISDDQLTSTLRTADDIENSFAGAQDTRYKIHTDVLNEKTLTYINNTFSQVKSNLEKHKLSIDANTFIQYVLLDNAGVNGKKILGGALRFKFEIATQLEHYSVGPVQEIMQILTKDTLTDDDISILRTIGCTNMRGDKEVLTLYNPMREESTSRNITSRENIGNIIGAVRKSAPSALWHLLNQASKISGAARALSGQAMASLIPIEMRFKYYDAQGNPVIDEQKIKLGGIGGPAVTEFQDVGYTAFVDYDEESGFKRIIVRQKAYSNPRDAT